MTDAPEKIWADKEFGYNDWDAGTFCTVSDGGTEYTRTDIADARYNKLERKAVNLTETQMQWEARIKVLESALRSILQIPNSDAAQGIMKAFAEDALGEQT